MGFKLTFCVLVGHGGMPDSGHRNTGTGRRGVGPGSDDAIDHDELHYTQPRNLYTDALIMNMLGPGWV